MSVRDDWRFTVSVVSGGHFLSHFYILAFPPLFPLLRSEFGLSNTELGLIVSVVSAATLLQAPVGELVDRVGAKWVLVAGIAVTSGGIALVGLAPTYPAILGLVVITGVGQSAFHPADYSLIDAVTGPDVEGKGFSLHTFSGFAGFAAAPVVVGTLGLAYGWRITLAAVGALGLLYATFVALALDPVYLREAGETASEASDPEGAFLSDLLRPGILALFALFVALAVAGKGVQAFTTILAVEYGLAEATGNTALTVYFTLASGGILAGGVLADRYRPHRVMAAGLGAGATLLVFAVSGLVPIDAASLVVLFGVVGFAVGLVFPSRDRLVSSLASSGATGKSFGFVFTGLTVGGLIGPTLLGAVGDVASITLAFVLVGGFYLAAAAVAFALGRHGASSPSAPTPAEGD